MLSNLEPKNVFNYFEIISKIPRKTYHEEEICNFLVSFAKARKLEFYIDDYNNVIIYKNATSGFESHDPIILQCHLDMVYSYDNKELSGINRIEILVNDNFITANGTTLGADNGIGIAYILAILDSKEIEHPSLECVFTSCEEEDMLGAYKLDKNKLKSKTLINLDNECDKYITNSCAGGIDLTLKLPISYTSVSGVEFQVSFEGLASGHSGFDIVKERANAIKLIGRLMQHLSSRISYSIKDIKGGSENSLIPNFSYINFIINQSDRDAFVYAINSYNLTLQNEYKNTEPNLNLSFEYKGEGENYTVLDKVSQNKVRFYLLEIPNGIRKMSREVLDLVQTSLNVGTVRLKENELITTHLIRSIVPSESKSLVDSLSVLIDYLGGYYNINYEIPIWNDKIDSYLKNITVPLYEKIFDRKPIIASMHGMLECSIFNDKISNLDAISIGPNIYNAHSPNEMLDINSVNKVWKFLIEILKNL